MSLPPPQDPKHHNNANVRCFVNRDQELRFTVHDCPDYYQFKISVFTDDKRTDLIGEAWIDLKNIVVPGGGQDDLWQNLSCKGKYAGEIRLEITYYDSRPKPEKPTAKSKQLSAADVEQASLRQKPPVKRRPLPTDPVTGEAPAPAPIPIGAISASNPDFYGPQQTPPRHVKHNSHVGVIPNHSPLQSLEYNSPPQGSRQYQADPYGTSPQSALSHGSPAYATPPRHSYPARDYGTPTRQMDAGGSPFDYEDDRSHYSQGERYDSPARESPRNLPPLDLEDTPPPPPVHRSRHSSAAPESTRRGSVDVSPQKGHSPMPMRHDVLKSEAHRHTPSASSAWTNHRPFDDGPSPTSPVSPMAYDTPSPRHHSYDSAYDSQNNSIYPSIEDEPESPAHHHMQYRSRHGSEVEQHPGHNPSPYTQSRSARDSPAYPGQPPRYNAAAAANRGRIAASEPPQQHPGSQGAATPARGQGRYGGDHGSGSPSYRLPAPPPSLAHSVDSRLARDASERVYDDRLYHNRDYTGQNTTPMHHRQRSEPPPSFTPSPRGYNPQSQDRRGGVTYSGAPQDTREGRSRNISTSPSPNPHHKIQRKSVSPIPTPEGRQISDIPFGPDSYDALNPSMVSSRSSNSAASGPERKDPNAKIIMYDGREVDPSDHLPMESWAPEPEPKQGQTQAVPEPRGRPSLGGAQPMPPSGRRQQRSSRPEPTPVLPPAYNHNDKPRTPPAPASGSRNRLQKKAAKGAVSPGASSPLAPITSENYQERHSAYDGRHARGGSYDYPNENHAPYYGNGPPIPAKLPVMSGGNGMSAHQMSMVEEMQRIDIGAGRSRRRGGY